MKARSIPAYEPSFQKVSHFYLLQRLSNYSSVHSGVFLRPLLVCFFFHLDFEDSCLNIVDQNFNCSSNYGAAKGREGERCVDYDSTCFGPSNGGLFVTSICSVYVGSHNLVLQASLRYNSFSVLNHNICSNDFNTGDWMLHVVGRGVQ